MAATAAAVAAAAAHAEPMKHNDEHSLTNGNHLNGSEDPFTETERTAHASYTHRFSSKFELDAADLGATSSPSQVKRVLEAHLIETERRLQDTHKLGTSLLEQQSNLQDKLREVEQQQDAAEISPELRRRLVSIGKEHDDLNREIARTLLAPKSRVVSGEDKSNGEPELLTSQATGSPTKISAPNRRSRNQPVNPAGDLQFYADISTSFMAQIRQLQALLAERDEALKSVNTERSRLEQNLQLSTQRLRSQDENEQRYKDENWNLEAQNHELLTAQREASDKEKRLNNVVAVANAERARLLSEIEESKLAHSKVVEDYQASKKSHETEMHSLKRDLDATDLDRSSLQGRIDDLTAQNQELAKAMAARLRNMSPQRQQAPNNDDDDQSRDLSTPEQSPPPSPTKATPRHGGLESETLRSSLHHAHRMIQNLKGNIHREKTEKIELKRMLQDARDELEQRRNDNGFSSGAKKQKAKAEVFKKPARPEVMGGNRRTRTDIELQDDDWEDQAEDVSGKSAVGRSLPASNVTDLSDAYQTAHETESNFDTADERMTTESEAFETGAESLAGDSTDDLTETESTAPRSRTKGSVRYTRPSGGFGPAGSRNSYQSTASTSAGEEDDDIQTPVQAQTSRFKLRNGRSSSSRQTQIYEGTPDTIRTQVSTNDSPAVTIDGRSPPAMEQSLFAELEGMNDAGSSFSTPARSGIIDLDSTPGISDTPSKMVTTGEPAIDVPEAEVPTTEVPVAEVPSIAMTPKVEMVDSATMTNAWQPDMASKESPALVQDPQIKHLSLDEGLGGNSRVVSIGDFPLPPNVASPPRRQVDTATQYTPEKSPWAQDQTTPQQHYDAATQYTPSRTFPESPVRGGNTFITPPKTVWDAEHESELGSPTRDSAAGLGIEQSKLAYSELAMQDTIPRSPDIPVKEPPAVLAYSTIQSQQIQPIAPPSPLPIVSDTTKQEHADSVGTPAGAAAGGILAGAAAALGLSWGKDETPTSTEHDTNKSTPDIPSEIEQRSGDVSSDAVLRKKTSTRDAMTQGAIITVSSNDQSSQTLLTSEEIERALQSKKDERIVPTIVQTQSDSASTAPSRSSARSPELSEGFVAASSPIPTSPPMRPSSSSSLRPSTANKQHPPLPSDYKTNIARANSQIQNNPPKKEPTTLAAGAVMGPPLMPASAMRRPKTPADSTRSISRENSGLRLTPSSRQQNNTSTVSQVSRRSSVSSFASELDERFNIRTGDGYQPAPGTDPRMIQAITQTMIGEYLWKYTRKPGSKDMSSTRHRRYFWVHPYTKTLYWSTTDPSLPGVKEGTSRSVPIESIRVVSDDNPMPPGLHRKSLEVTTPSRKVKFTATTGQRHETWFNALSYLLLRGEPPDVHGAYSTGGNEITRDDVDEFRVSGHNPHLVPVSRASMSSYNSRTTTGTSKRVSATVSSGQRQPLPSNVISTSNNTLRQQNSSVRHSSVPPTADSARTSRTEPPPDTEKNRPTRSTSVSRVSRMLGSITGRSSKQYVSEQAGPQKGSHARGESRGSDSIYEASVVTAGRDSAEETRKEMLRQEAAGLGTSNGLENVRACCDGKHDVSTLHHSHRHSDRQSTLGSMSDRINRSMSKRI